MAAHLSTQQVADYRQQRLAPTALIAVDDHLADCAACRRLVEVALPGAVVALYADLQAVAATLPHAAVHLSFEQIADCVDEKLVGTELQFVNDHLVACAACAHAAADLRSFKDELAAPVNAARPLTVAISKQGWREKLQHWLWPRSPAWAFGGALALLLIVVWAGWLLNRRRTSETTPREIAETGASPSPTLAVAPSPVAPPEPEPIPLLAQLRDGAQQVTLDRAGKLAGLEHLPAAYQQVVKEALTNQRVPQSSALAGLQRRASSLMGADDEGNKFSLRAPIGQVVLHDRPVFQWSHLSGATGYVVEVYDAQFNLVAQSQPLPDNTWTPAQPLARGQSYAWQVRALKDGQEFPAPRPPAPQAKFRVLDETKASELAQARRAYASSHLTLGVLYAQAGLLDEAQQELRALQKANPDAPLVRRLLASVQALRRG